MHLTALTTYPLKGARGVLTPRGVVDREGLRGDRRWMLVDAQGATVSAGSAASVLAVEARASGDGGLELRRPGVEALHVPPPATGSAERVPVTLSRVGEALAAGPEADAWVSAAVGRPVRLVRADDRLPRTVSPAHGGRPGDVLSFADAGPLLLTTEASLARLDRWVAQTWAERYAACGAQAGSRPEPLAMARFRPNLVIGGHLEPFAEDDWSEVCVGDVRFRVAERCDRCAVTTLDPWTQVRGPEPLRSLSRFRRWDGAVWFGVRLVPLTSGTVAVGDEVVAH